MQPNTSFVGGHFTVAPGETMPTEPPGTYDATGLLLLLLIGVWHLVERFQRGSKP